MVGTVFVAIAPWHQSVKGTGNVIAYAPLDRQKTIETPIKGQVVRLGKRIFENAHVSRGDLNAEVADIDAEYTVRLEGQLSASHRQVEAAEALLEANSRNDEAAKTIVAFVESQAKAESDVAKAQ